MICFGSYESQNIRYKSTMEDTSHIDDLFIKTHNGYGSYLAVFDGHAGKLTANWCEDNFHQLLYKNLKKYSSNLEIPNIIDFTFQQADIAIQNDSKITDYSGSTASIAYIHKNYDKSIYLYTANVGDSRIVLSTDDGLAYRLSYDHSADDPNERARVIRSGGDILLGRVCGVLAITRALGDTRLKDYVCPRPFITETKIDENDEFLILASDGVWDVFTDQEAVDKIRNIEDPDKAAKLLVNESIRRGSVDNITCIVVRFIDIPKSTQNHRRASSMTTHVIHNNEGLPLSPLSPSQGEIKFSGLVVQTSKFKHIDMASMNYGLDRRPPSPPQTELLNFKQRRYSENDSPNIDSLESQMTNLSIKTGKRFRYGVPRIEQPLIFDQSNYEDAIEDD